MNNRNTGILLSYVNTFLNMICGLFLSSFLLRTLGDTEYGIYQMISSFANYLVLLEFGVGTVMTRNLSMCRGQNQDQKEIDKNTSTLWWLTNLLSLVILLVSVGFYCSIGRIYSNSLSIEQIIYAKKIFIFIALYLIFSFYIQSLNGIALANEKYAFSSVQNIVRTVVRTLLLVVLMLNFKQAILIAMIDMGLSFLMLLFCMVYCKKSLHATFSSRLISREILKSSLPLCIAIFLQTIVNQANNNVDKFVIGIILTPEMVAVYSVALYIFSMFSSLTTIPVSMYSPQIASLMSQGKTPKELTENLIEPCRMIAMVGGLILFGFTAVGKQFVEIVYGSGYEIAWVIALLIMTPMYINMITGVLVNILNVLNKRIIRSVILLGTTTANIVLTVIWIKKYGIIGAAAATALCTFIGQVFIMNLYYKIKLDIPIGYIYRRAAKGIIPYMMIGTVLSFILSQLISNVYVSFLVGGSIFILIFAGGYWFFGATASEKQTIRQRLGRR